MMRQYGLRLLVAALMVALLAGARPGVATARGEGSLAAGEPPDETPRVVVIAAWEPELEALLEKLQEEDRTVIQGRTFYVGKMGGMDVVVTLSGMSMVNAAMTTEIALREFNPVAIINTGIAGGVSPELSIGDVVIPEQWAEYLESVLARQTEDGYAPGDVQHVEEIAPFGMIYPRAVEVAHASGEADAEELLVWFPGDPGLLQLAGDLADSVKLDTCTPDDRCLDHEPRVVVGGNGVSASAFMDNADVRTWLASAFDAEAVDMESAAIGQVAYTADVPFLAMELLKGETLDNVLAREGRLSPERAAALGGSEWSLAAINAGETFSTFKGDWHQDVAHKCATAAQQPTRQRAHDHLFRCRLSSECVAGEQLSTPNRCRYQYGS